MENENSKKKTTAPDTSVGADDGQPLHNPTENSISAFDEEINGDFQNSTESLDEIYRRIQRLTDPHYLHTISMTELYQTAYQSRSPIISVRETRAGGQNLVVHHRQGVAGDLFQGRPDAGMTRVTVRQAGCRQVDMPIIQPL